MKTIAYQMRVLTEYRRAREIFPKFASGHEGYAIIKEEIDELWDEIKKSKNSRNINEKMVKECIQISAMCLAFVMDLQENKHSFNDKKVIK